MGSWPHVPSAQVFTVAVVNSSLSDTATPLCHRSASNLFLPSVSNVKRKKNSKEINLELKGGSLNSTLSKHVWRLSVTELRPFWTREGKIPAFSPQHPVAGQSFCRVLVRLLVSANSTHFWPSDPLNISIFAIPTCWYPVSFTDINWCTLKLQKEHNGPSKHVWYYPSLSHYHVFPSQGFVPHRQVIIFLYATLF